MNTNKHCCKEMTTCLEGNKEFHSIDADELHLRYMPQTKEYAIDCKEGCGGGVQLINYCPWCGTELPRSLRSAVVFNDKAPDFHRRNKIINVNDHCCKEMTTNIAVGELYFTYEPRTRVYGIDYKEECGGGIQMIKYCPWCGKKLPKFLAEVLGDIIFDQLNLDSFSDDPRMPEEFKTDEWWKKRGL